VATLTRAIILAARYHEGQKDKGNQPYLFHPLRLMLNALTEDEQIVAVLHDTIEDTELTLDMLRQEGFSERIIEAIDALSRRKKEAYQDFILRIKQNSLARRVKILDLQDNMTPLRLHKKSDKDKDRLKKYSRALDTLLGGFPPAETQEEESQAAAAEQAAQADEQELQAAAQVAEAEEPQAKAAKTAPAAQTEDAGTPAKDAAATEPQAVAEPADGSAEAAGDKPKRSRGAERTTAAAKPRARRGRPPAAAAEPADGTGQPAGAKRSRGAERTAAAKPRARRGRPPAAAAEPAVELAVISPDEPATVSPTSAGDPTSAE
jgi:chemotaxis protein histidine kinase CheA